SSLRISDETRRPTRYTRFPYTTLFRSGADVRGENLRPAGLQTHFDVRRAGAAPLAVTVNLAGVHNVRNALAAIAVATELDIADEDRKSTRLNSSHLVISYAVFCLKKKR